MFGDDVATAAAGRRQQGVVSSDNVKVVSNGCCLRASVAADLTLGRHSYIRHGRTQVLMNFRGLYLSHPRSCDPR